MSALDITKFGRTPYKKIDRPQRAPAAAPHVRRYVMGVLEKTLAALLPASVFLVSVWPYNFAGADGFARQAVWIFLASAILSLWALVVAVFRRSIAVYYRRFVVLGAVFCVLLVVGLFVGNKALALGFVRPGGGVTFFALLFLALIAILLATFRFEARFFKSVLIAHFLGSALLGLHLVGSALFGSGYERIGWLVTQSWDTVFAVTIFLLTAFAMLQKGVAKAVWIACIIIHLVALFVWDRPLPWQLLLGGISMLLLFQALYSKKLWQRNFIFPLQVWVAAFLLLIIPIKVFSGKTVPLPPSIGVSGVRALVSKQSGAERMLGAGIGSASEQARLVGVSFYSPEDSGQAASLEEVMVPSGLAQVIVELGVLGTLVLLCVIYIYIKSGVSFLKQHYASIKKQSMPESVYLGAVLFIAAVMVIVAFLFTPWSFVFAWFLFLLVGLSFGLWTTALLFIRSQADGAKPEEVLIRDDIDPSGIVGQAARIAAYGSIALVFVILVYGTRIAGAERTAARAHAAASPIDAVRGFKRAVERNPWNETYQLRLAQADAASLSGSALDAQKDSIEEATKILRKLSEQSDDPLVYWQCAVAYRELEQFAEGSAQLARGSYLLAAERWPNNVALPVALAQFYRSEADSIVSADVSASQIRQEASRLLSKALSLEPAYLSARLELGLIIEEEEGSAQAIAELEPWEQESPEIAYHVGRMYFNEGDVEKAIEKFNTVALAVPNHSNAYYSLGVAHFRLEQYDDSLTSFEKVLELNPGNADVEEKIKQVKARL